MSSKSKIFATMKYEDAHAAMKWLCEALGFEKHLVVDGPDGTVAHAQMRYKDVMIMLGSTGDQELDKYMKSPGELRGINTQSAYILVDDIDAHYRQAKTFGAKIILDIKDEEYGGRGYTCQDPQGVIWNFGTYNPWDSKGESSSD